MKVHMTKRYVRYRIREPKDFVKNSFRTHDIGRVGHTKRIAGILKKSGKWATQAIIVNRKDYEQGLRVRMIRGRPVVKLKKVL